MWRYLIQIHFIHLMIAVCSPRKLILLFRTKGKDDLSVQAFRDLFAENQVLGERLHAFILKVSTTNRVDVEIFVDVCNDAI